MKKIKLSRIIIYILLILLTVICFLPFYIMIINATHSSNELMTGLYLLPGASIFQNYLNMREMIQIGRGFLNSVIISFFLHAAERLFRRADRFRPVEIQVQRAGNCIWYRHGFHDDSFAAGNHRVLPVM